MITRAGELTVSRVDDTPRAVEAVSCIFCGDEAGGRSRPYHEENGYQAVSCEGCGLVFVTPRPTEAEMKRLYEGQETKVDLGLQIRNVERARYEARRALELVGRFAPHGGGLLEIGSAAGYFLNEAKRAGYRPKGIDITGPFVTFAREVLGLEVFEGTLATAPFPPKSFDIVYHRNVLSHLAYPMEAFQKMHELLRPGGLLVYQTGNVAELPGEHWAGTNELDLPDHLYHFGEKHLRMLNERTGFETLEVKRYTLLLHEPRVRAFLASVRSAFSPKPAAKGPGREEKNKTFVVPREIPHHRLSRTIEVLADGYITYELGAVAPSEGRRATLIVVARARG